ncbi:hypothetical protein BD779DRAFT_466921 [Infundibulicybe gibba]|nr:hypothetical protein BD779DRAFT_466921 [Infundibulicybe gibba]
MLATTTTIPSGLSSQVYELRFPSFRQGHVVRKKGSSENSNWNVGSERRRRRRGCLIWWLKTSLKGNAEVLRLQASWRSLALSWMWREKGAHDGRLESSRVQLELQRLQRDDNAAAKWFQDTSCDGCTQTAMDSLKTHHAATADTFLRKSQPTRARSNRCILQLKDYT